MRNVPTTVSNDVTPNQRVDNGEDIAMIYFDLVKVASDSTRENWRRLYAPYHLIFLKNSI